MKYKDRHVIQYMGDSIDTTVSQEKYIIILLCLLSRCISADGIAVYNIPLLYMNVKDC